ncbi:MAG: sigma-70 family RNA polymerase sigma factor [Clostridia bacterium]|nr:sigma-70 family RNA polymerase sigma factor [Clostridia bacterium]
MQYEGLDDNRLVELSRAGDEGATDALFARYKNVVQQRARRFYMLGADQDDVVQEGMIGLFKAIRSFDPAGGASFSTYTKTCVTNQILNAIEAASAGKHAPLNSSVSLDTPEREEESLTLGQKLTAGQDSNPAEQLIYAEALSLLLSQDSRLFSPLEKQVARKLASGLGYRRIAEELGKSPKSIDNAIQRIRRKLKDFFD